MPAAEIPQSAALKTICVLPPLAEVMLKIVEHSLKTFAGKSWTDFIPAESHVLGPDCDLEKCPLTPVKHMKLLTLAWSLLAFALRSFARAVRCAQVADEEGTQVKGFNFAAEKLHARCVSEGELGHPMWNAFKRAISAMGWDLDVLRLSLICALAALSRPVPVANPACHLSMQPPRQFQPW